VVVFLGKVNHRDTENTEVTQRRKLKLRHYSFQELT